MEIFSLIISQYNYLLLLSHYKANQPQGKQSVFKLQNMKHSDDKQVKQKNWKEVKGNLAHGHSFSMHSDYICCLVEKVLLTPVNKLIVLAKT